MSTRAQIKVKGSEVMIYKHHDGYPKGVIPTLKGVMSTFRRARGDEPDYALAQIMRAFARRDEQRRRYRLNDPDNQFRDNYKHQSMTGWGIDTIEHGDIEYLYTVDLSKGRIKIEPKGIQEHKPVSFEYLD